MSKPFDSAQEIPSILTQDLYATAAPQVDGLKQVIDTLKDRVQPLSSVQLQAVGYLKFLSSRRIHKDKKVYDDIINQVVEEREKLARPGFFIRLIEAVRGGTMYVNNQTQSDMQKEREGKK